MKRLTINRSQFTINKHLPLRKIFLFLFASGLLTLLVWFFFIQEIYRNPFGSVQSIEAIPQNTPIILEFDDYYMLRHEVAKMPYADEMSGAFFVKKMSEDFRIIRQLFAENKNHLQLLLNSPITAGLHLSGKSEVDFLYVLQDEKGVFKLPELLEKFSFQKSNANQNTVYQLELVKGEKYTIAVYQDLIMISKYAYLVESAMQQLKSPANNLYQDDRLRFFQKTKRTKHQMEVSVIFENLTAFANPFLDKDATKYLNYFSKNISSGHWILDFQKAGVSINGSLKTKNGNIWLENLFSNNTFPNSKSAEILPKNVGYFFRHSLKGLSGNLNSNKKSNSIFEKSFLPWIGEEWLVGRTEIFTRKMRAEKFIAYQIKKGKKKTAQHYLEKLTDSLGVTKSWDYQTYNIRQIYSDNLPVPFLRDGFLLLKKPCYAFIDDYVVFSGAPRILENWIDQFVTNQTLASHVPYLKMKGRGGKSGVVEFYWNPRMANQFLKNSFDAKKKKVKKQIDLWENFPVFGMNADWEKGEFVTNGYLFYEKENQERAKVKWRTPLKSQAITQPFAIYNDEKGAYDILIQDEEWRLYLLNQDGEIVWEKMLTSPIQSKIYAADFFENSASGILFNTLDKIYLLDLEGNDKNEFPLALSSPASNGLLLADFGEADFGIYVACENEIIYGFDKKGIPLSGWNSIEGAGEVNIPMRHFETEDEDFIVVINSEGSIFSFRKNGFVSMKAAMTANESNFPLCFQLAEDIKSIVYGQKNGSIKVISLDAGNLDFLQNEKRTIDDFKFISADIAGNNYTDYVVLNNKELTITYRLQNTYQEYGSYQFSNQQDAIFPVQSKSMGKAMIGSLCKKQNKIFLLDKKGQLHADFPLAGTTKFELLNLFSEDKNSILVADGDQVVVYE
ncbi:MAG: hypothetical protein ACJAT4_000478 [Granulosicoccus sp.]|jgi:hypothetical protein